MLKREGARNRQVEVLVAGAAVGVARQVPEVFRAGHAVLGFRVPRARDLERREVQELVGSVGPRERIADDVGAAEELARP